MNINKMKILLSELNIHIIEEETIIYHDISYNSGFPLENHYGIRLNEKQYWEFCFVQLERRSIPEYKKIKEFNNKEDALIYFFLDRLRDYFLTNEVNLNMDFEIENWTTSILLTKLKSCNIPQCYLSYGDLLNKYSIKCFETDGSWYNAIIGGNKEILVISPPLEDRNTAFLSTFRRIYLLFLFNKYVKNDKVIQVLDRKFTDVEIAWYLKYEI